VFTTGRETLSLHVAGSELLAATLFHQDQEVSNYWPGLLNASACEPDVSQSEARRDFVWQHVCCFCRCFMMLRQPACHRVIFYGVDYRSVSTFFEAFLSQAMFLVFDKCKYGGRISIRSLSKDSAGIVLQVRPRKWSPCWESKPGSSHDAWAGSEKWSPGRWSRSQSSKDAWVGNVSSNDAWDGNPPPPPLNVTARAAFALKSGREIFGVGCRGCVLFKIFAIGGEGNCGQPRIKYVLQFIGSPICMCS